MHHLSVFLWHDGPFLLELLLCKHILLECGKVRLLLDLQCLLSLDLLPRYLVILGYWFRHAESLIVVLTELILLFTRWSILGLTFVRTVFLGARESFLLVKLLELG